MATEVRKTEQPQLLAALLISAQMLVPVSVDSFTVSLEQIREGCGAERADILQVFSVENPVTHAGFRCAYEPGRDRIHFSRIDAKQAAAIAREASASAQVAAQAASPKVDSPMSTEQLMTIATQEWATDANKLHREFRSEASYLAFRKAEFEGRARIFGRTVIPTACKAAQAERSGWNARVSLSGR
jgi:hypothetical protein